MTRRLFFLFLWLALAVSWFGISAAAATDEKPKGKDATFDLKEASIFDNGNVGAIALAGDKRSSAPPSPSRR